MARDPFDFGPPPSGSQNGAGAPGPNPWGGELLNPGPGDPWGSGPSGSAGSAGSAAAGTATATDADQDVLYGRPPLPLLVAALVLAAAAGLVAVLRGADVSIALACWVVAGPVAIGLLALFAQRNTAARARPIYLPPPGLAVLTWATYLVVAAAILLSALRIADWAGHL